jgi:hypothetical protein
MKFLDSKQRLTELALWADAEHPSIEAKEAIITLQKMVSTLRTSTRHGSPGIIQSERKRKARTESWKNGTSRFRLSLDDERVKHMMDQFYLTVDRSAVGTRVKRLHNYNSRSYHCLITSRGQDEDEDV